MKTYWHTFIERYRDRMAFVPIATMLEAFYHWSADPHLNGIELKNKCDEIMGLKKRE